MSSDLTPLPQPSALARVSSPRSLVTAEDVKRWTDNPLWQLPAEWRIPAWEFWAFWSGIEPAQLPLTTRLRRWIDDGLTLDDARKVFAELTDSAEADRITAKWELTAALAAKVRVTLKRRRAEREAAERRTQTPATADLIRGIGRDV